MNAAQFQFATRTGARLARLVLNAEARLDTKRKSSPTPTESDLGEVIGLRQALDIFMALVWEEGRGWWEFISSLFCRSFDCGQSCTSWLRL